MKITLMSEKLFELIFQFHFSYLTYFIRLRQYKYNPKDNRTTIVI